MNTDLLAQLKNYYEEDPNDPFNIYALATEYKKTNHQEALRLYLEVANKFPDYVATYYHLAKLYETMNLRQLAIDTYERGMEVAKGNENRHSYNELRNAYDELIFE